MEGKWLSTTSIHPLIKCRLHAGVEIVEKEGDRVFIPQDVIQDAIEEFTQQDGHKAAVDEIEDSDDEDMVIQMDGCDEDQMEGDIEEDMEQ